jgi:hypothetical protein
MSPGISPGATATPLPPTVDTPTLAQQRIYSGVDTCKSGGWDQDDLTHVSEDAKKFETRRYGAGDAEYQRFRQCLRDRFGFRFPGDPGYSGWGSGTR